MKPFRNLFLAAAALASVYVLSSFPVPAVAEQFVFSSQAAADQVEPLTAVDVVKFVVALAAALIVLMAVYEVSQRRQRRRPAAEFNSGYDAADYHLDAGIPRIRDPDPS